jgi:hypothetical protein
MDGFSKTFISLKNLHFPPAPDTLRFVLTLLVFD